MNLNEWQGYPNFDVMYSAAGTTQSKPVDAKTSPAQLQIQQQPTLIKSLFLPLLLLSKKTKMQSLCGLA